MGVVPSPRLLVHRSVVAADQERKVDVPLLRRGGCLKQGDPGALVGEHLLPASISAMAMEPDVIMSCITPSFSGGIP
jgi:hypothetical protein